jgi:glutamate-5-semialdehyde dehydrogenase
MTITQTALPLSEIAQRTRQAARKLATLSTSERNQAIAAIATALQASAPQILAANQADCEAALAEGLPKPLYGRLKLDADKLSGAIEGVRDVGRLPDPVGQVQIHRELDAGLVLQRITCPLGVLGVIFEARPDAVMQIASLAIKSGNGVILKGGREAMRSCTALVEAIQHGLNESDLDPAIVQLLTTREETVALLKLDQYVDLIIPRGSNSFVRFIQENTKIPVLGHADLEQAVAIAVDSKIQYPSACNSIETLLVHQAIAPQFLEHAIPALQAKDVQLRGDEQTLTLSDKLALSEPLMAASEDDWSTEYSDLILSIKVVNSLDEAIAHINTYGSRHTEGIVTTDLTAAAQFMADVDAAGVFHNCSTRFADGFRYGFGAEVGISTQKMPPRGPVGMEGLVTYKYQVVGAGHIVASYSGANARPFIHRDL